MRIALVLSLIIASCLSSASTIPSDRERRDAVGPDALSIRDAEWSTLLPRANSDVEDATPLGNLLEKRKGGGGGGKSGGSSSGSSGSSSGSSGSSGGGARSGTSNTGGSSPGGSGAAPRYGPAGNSYKGGASSPYRAGGRTPGGIAPFLLAGVAVGFLAGSALAYGAYFYSFPNSVTYFNQTANRNQTSKIQCYCAQYQECSCDQMDDSDEDNYVKGLIGDGSYQTLQQNNITNTNNGTLYVDGTLDNGTTADSGPAPASSGSASSVLLENAGWAGLAATVACVTFLS